MDARSFYTLLPAKNGSPARTFLVVPPAPLLNARFSPAEDSAARDEITAHVNMFDKSPGTYALGRETARLVGEWVDEARKGRMGWWKGEPAAAVGEKEKEKVEVDGSAAAAQVEDEDMRI